MNVGDPRGADIAARALAGHRRFRGKIQMAPKVPVGGSEDFALWYTPGVAAVSRAIAADPAASFDLTGRGDTVAILTDGSRVLGLGDIGPEAALPVMEGKALLFKMLGGVDAVPVCVEASGADELIAIARAIAPGFGAINLEDIATPACFRVLEALQETLPIPVWHDDQQGTAVAALAGLRRSLALTGRRLGEVRIAFVGIGAANMATCRLLRAAGADPVRMVACDSTGTLHTGRADIEAARETLPEKWAICRETNPERIAGGIAEALRGADVCLAFSQPGPGTIPPEAVAGMAPRAIVFACANPVPEIWPEDALAAGAEIVATGRSDFPNQVNNALAFPGLFRGVLDARARRITDAMALAAADALVRRAESLSADGPGMILPPIEDRLAAAEVAAAVAYAAQQAGEARRAVDPEEVRANTLSRTGAAAELAAGIAARAGVPWPVPEG
ncbi:NADP-dependent malic enzyme [Limibaculum sp. FT325]|uniref:NAD(P)-dependent malic enzyme n=1 Tax=Thermohalobaculum sediminis TaxID=2939436 RepID=UPI0020BF1223|nr:NADP-dependent malic enzyme [Limibaculum sediminis]MCL5778301.1 NADP-dependent malic enzyme [Limibaculum sediminis]